MTIAYLYSTVLMGDSRFFGVNYHRTYSIAGNMRPNTAIELSTYNDCLLLATF